MSISMAQVNNRDVHIQLGTPTSVSSVAVGVAPVTPMRQRYRPATQYTLDEVNLDPVNGFVYRKDTGELVGIGGYGSGQQHHHGHGHRDQRRSDAI